MCLKYISVFLFLVCGLYSNRAGAQFFQSHKYTIENSSAEGNIARIWQDQTGAMWWVNDENFTRFNGIVYQNIKYGKLAAPYKQVFHDVDYAGNLFLCLATNNKIDIFEYRDNKWEKAASFVNTDTEPIIGFGASNAEGNISAWVATASRILSWEKKEWKEVPLDNPGRILRFYKGKKSSYVVAQNAIYLVPSGKPVKLNLPPDVTANFIAANYFSTPFKPQNEPELWVLTNNFIGYIKNGALSIITYYDSKAYRFVRLRYDGNNNVYLLDADNRLWVYGMKTSAFEKVNIEHQPENANQLFTDRENNLWVATEDGIVKVTNQNISFLGKSVGLSGMPVQAVAAAGEKLYAAGPKGINVLQNGVVKQYLPYGEGLYNARQRILQLWANDAGNIWLLSNVQGLWRSADGVAWENTSGNIDFAAFSFTPDGRLYAVSAKELFEYTNGGWKQVGKLPTGVSANRLDWYNNGLLLLTDKGVYHLAAKKWSKLRGENGELFHDAAYSYKRVYDNLAIMGTAKGLYYIKEFDLVKYAADSLSAKIAHYGIDIDKNGAVWLTSDTGVIMMDKRGPPKIFPYKGMQFREGDNSSVVSDSNGQVWIALRTGLMVYLPEFLTTAVNKPLVHLNRIESRDVTLTAFNTTTLLNLESEDNDLTFYFDANSFVDEGKNKLLYKLEGHMNHWEEITGIQSNHISFKGLDAGKYVFKLQLVSANGVASDIVSSPAITISKPFYNQWWFYASVIAGFFAISFAVFYVYGQKKFEKDLLLEVDSRSRELRSSEERFRTLWENTSDALALYNMRGDLVIYNNAFLQLLGRREGLAGRKIYEVLNITDAEMSTQAFRQNLELQQLKPQFEMRTAQGGQELILEFSNTYLLLPNEKTWVMLSIIRNVTQRKQTEDNLIKAKNEAERASRVKSAFLATMSHEIRTPLNAIMGMSSVMRNTELSEEQRNYVNAIKTSSDSLLSLVNNILDFSKIEAGMMMIEKTGVMPEECITETLEILGNLANEKGIYLYYRIHPDVPINIISDKTRLRQVLINLVGNAIKFTQSGYIEIAMRPEPDHMLKISVTDTGIGIPENKIGDLFKVFTQVDDSITRKYGGSGLGLAITDKLVALLGGTIKVASKPGRGSQFTFTLKDFSLGKDLIRRGDVIKKYKDVNIALITPRLELVNVFRFLNDERGIKTTVAENLKDIAHIAGELNAVFIDSEHARIYSMPEALKNKDYYLIKRHLKQVPEDIARILEANEKKTINIPITSAHYQRILDRIVPQKAGKIGRPEQTADDMAAKVMPLQILVVDDNSVNLMMMEVIMKNIGYKIEFAENGRVAVEKAQNADYDLIFMDLQMPEMDGFEATQIIKAKQPGNKPYIVALTANAFPEDKEACLNAGMIDFLPKPVSVEMIKKLIFRLFVENRSSTDKNGR